MKTIIRKAYWNYEKEEKWLNEMSIKGFALIDYSWCRYVFEDSKPSEYTYRIELLEYLPSHPVSQKYLGFMQENGIEHIASYMRWVYFRKKALDGEFNIYSDIDSKVKHYQRINLLWTVLACVEFLIGVSNVSIGIGLILQNHLFNVNLIGVGICLGLGIICLALGRPNRKKIKALKKKKTIME